MFGVFKKANSDVTAAEVKDIIRATVQPLKSAQQTTQWGGAVDAAAAVLVRCFVHACVGSVVTNTSYASMHMHSRFACVHACGYIVGNMRACTCTAVIYIRSSAIYVCL